MPDNCSLQNVPYFTWSQGHTPLNVCGAPPEQPVVAFNNEGLGVSRNFRCELCESNRDLSIVLC